MAQPTESPSPEAELPRLFVTGSGGFVGQALRRHWVSGGWSSAFQWVEPEVEYDLRDPESVQRAVDATRPQAVLHLAAQSFVPAAFKDPAGTLAVNVGGTLNLLQALRSCSFTGRLLFVSSADIYGAVPADQLPVTESRLPQPRNPYAVSKAAAELLCQQWHHAEGLDVVIARPFNHVGPGQEPRFVLSGFARQVARIQLGLDAPRLVTGNLAVSRDFSSVESVLDAYLALLQKGTPGEIYNVCSGRELLLSDALRQLMLLASVEASVNTDPALLRPNEQVRMQGSPARLVQQTGWRPETSLDPTLAAMLEWWLSKEKLHHDP